MNVEKICRSDMGRLREEYAIRLTCPNLRFITSFPSSPKAPTIRPSRAKSANASVARVPGGMTVRNRGRRKEPMKAMAKISTGKRAKLALPKRVAWSRHSSLTMETKSSNMGPGPHQGEEELVQVAVLLP